MKKWLLITGLFILTSCSPEQAQLMEDPRSHAHGVSIVENSVIWSEKSDEQRDESWTHDIYKKEIGQTQLKTVVTSPEAQEPVDAHNVYFVTLNKEGLQEVKINLDHLNR